MSRLYYPKAAQAALVEGDNAEKSGSGTEFTKKIGKLVPVELVAAYGAMVSAASAVDIDVLTVPLFWVAFVLCLVLTPYYLRKVAEHGMPSRNHLIVSTIAFPIWAYTVSGNQVLPEAYYDAALATFITIGFTLVSGLVPMNK